MSTRRINDLLNLSEVVHWHSVPTIKKRSVAEHSFRVAVIVMELYERLDWQDKSGGSLICLRMLEWALKHDGPETETGDLPHTAKALLPDGTWSGLEKKLCPWYPDYYSYPLVKVADLAEQYMYICKYRIQFDSEGRNAEVATREQLNLAIDACGISGLNEAVYRIIEDSRLPSDTRHAQGLMPDGSGRLNLERKVDADGRNADQSVPRK